MISASRKSVLYISILLSIAFITFMLVWFGYAQKPTVSITYNVGEIVGGSLIGISSVIASMVYALQRFGKNKSKKQKDRQDPFEWYLKRYSDETVRIGKNALELHEMGLISKEELDNFKDAIRSYYKFRY